MSTTQLIGDVVDAQLLAEITGDVFTGMFGEERERPYLLRTADVAYDVQSTVDITGGWNGSVSFSCDLAFVRTSVAELFCLSADVVTIADVEDLAGEVVNVIGGNVKSLLPGPSALSLPRTVLDGSSVGARAAVSVDLRWSGHTMRVDVATGGAAPH